MRAGLYARVSTERQADRGTIGSQLALLREHIAAAGDELVGEYVDDGHSGARLDRPGLDALRDAAEAGLLERVWCLSPDRLARAYAYQVLVLDERRGRRGPVKLRPEIVDFIRADTGSGAQIAEQVADRFGVRLHRRTVERVRGR